VGERFEFANITILVPLNKKESSLEARIGWLTPNSQVPGNNLLLGYWWPG